MCELKCEKTLWVIYSRITFKRARLGGVQFFPGVPISCFLKIWRRTGDESVLLLWWSRLLPKASVSLPSSLIFPELQARIDGKNLVTWCLFALYLIVKASSRMGSIVLLKGIIYSC